MQRARKDKRYNRRESSKLEKTLNASTNNSLREKEQRGQETMDDFGANPIKSVEFHLTFFVLVVAEIIAYELLSEFAHFVNPSVLRVFFCIIFFTSLVTWILGIFIEDIKQVSRSLRELLKSLKEFVESLSDLLESIRRLRDSEQKKG
ncbi:MAG: hypothetical protein ACLQPD_28115 [Desulfomonilaceae bacterium]